MLYDNHGRVINYLRLAVTDRCNLRCFYCMPEEGITYAKRTDLLTYEEMHRLVRVMGDLGISKLRLTGGEPFVRRDFMQFLESVCALDTIKQVHITTNGTYTADKIGKLEELGIKSINLSLDSLDEKRFFQITRRDLFQPVRQTLDDLIASSIDTKINMVVMQGRNTEDILPMLELTKEKDVAVRFIEEMPFNGTDGQGNATFWPMKKILEFIQNHHNVEKLEDPPFSTSKNYRIKGYKGSFGIIAAFTRTFCGTCNRIRVTPKGDLKTCLYDDGVLNFRDIIRGGATDAEVADHLKKALSNRAKDGFEAEKNRQKRQNVSESMATIGG